jgi:hypothetical protein
MSACPGSTRCQRLLSADLRANSKVRAPGVTRGPERQSPERVRTVSSLLANSRRGYYFLEARETVAGRAGAGSRGAPTRLARRRRSARVPRRPPPRARRTYRARGCEDYRRGEARWAGECNTHAPPPPYIYIFFGESQMECTGLVRGRLQRPRLGGPHGEAEVALVVRHDDLRAASRP